MIGRPNRPVDPRWLAAVIWLLLAGVSPSFAQAPVVTSVVPAAVSADVTVRVTGSGFGATVATNEVTFTPASGAPALGVVTAVSAADASGAQRRLTVRLPPLPVGRASITVRNTVTGLSGGGASVEVVSVAAGTTALEPGQTRDIDLLLLGDAAFDPVSTRVTLGAGISVNRVTVAAPTRLVANVTVAPAATLGPRVLGVLTPVMTATRADALRVVAPPSGGGAPPVAVIAAPDQAATGELVAFDGTGSTDPDGDQLAYDWSFSDGATASGPVVTRSFATPGQVTATLTVRDGTNQATAQRTITIVEPTPPVALLSIAVDPPSVAFGEAGATRQLTVTGSYSDQSTRDLTAASTGTIYETSNQAVVTVSPDGLLAAAGNGTATVTARNGGRQATVQVSVTIVSLTGLDVSPARATLRAVGAALPLTVLATFSDGSTRNVSRDAATSYDTSDGGVATIAAGIVTAAAAGRATITARFGGFSGTTQIDVVLGSATGAGFVRGEVFDDRTGLPLPGAFATLLADGSGPLASPVEVTADTRGRFVLPARAGVVLVRLSKPGFTSVDRVAVAASDAAVTLLDARLTSVEQPRAVITPAFGGVAANARGDVLLHVPAGAVQAETPVSLTSISNQGLAGRLPLGWSPVFAVEVGSEVPLSAPATLTVPVLDALLATGTDVALARYDAAAQAWRALPPARVGTDGKTMTAAVDAAGQFVFLVPDQAPFTPPSPVVGEPLAGVSLASLPGSLSATGVVVPRAAPPGDEARAVGTVVLEAGEAMPSGVVVRARVAEQFDLLDQTRLVPAPYTQDLVVYARPRVPQGGRLATSFPITPSLAFTIQQLALGVVRVDVTADEPVEGGAVVGEGGATVGDAAAALLDVPEGALAGDAFVGVVPIAAAAPPLQVPAGLTALGGATIDLVGVTFARAATISIPRPAGLAADAVVVLAEVFVDPLGGRRLRLVGRGLVGPSRITTQLAVGGLELPGVTRGGDYLFVQLANPIGLVDGSVRGTGGATPFAGALVTADTAPFADVSTSAGRFVVAGRVGAATTVGALDTLGGDGASGEVTPAAPFGVTPLALTLEVLPPSVVETSPAANASGVPLNSTIVVTFSEPIDPSSVTAEAIVVRVGTADVEGDRVLSADRRRVTFRPAAPLAGLATHVVTVSTAIRDTGGNLMVAPVTFEFRTLDPSKPPQPEPGQIEAELPDDDGFVLITGSPGTSEAARAVTATNPRTQETITVLALEDGSFRLRVPAVVGDEITLTLREAGGREVTFLISQFTGAGGQTSIGTSGGTLRGGTRTATIRPRSLTAAGVFQFREAAAGALPGETGDYTYVDRFGIAVGGAQFNQLRSLTLSESQGRFPQSLAGDAPFTTTGSLVVPPDFLVSASLRFAAAATDAGGRRHTVEGVTVVVGSAPDASRVEVPNDAQFPLVYLDVPRQALPNQQVLASAVAPAARIEFDVQVPPPGGGATPSHFLVGAVAVGADRKLRVLDELSLVTAAGASLLRTTGRVFPGVTASGDYGIAAFSTPIAHVTGRVTGPPAIVTADNWPLAAVTTTANGRFVLPVRASATVALRFLDASTFAELGTATAQTPAEGTVDLGVPLGAGVATLTVTATPDARFIVDIGDPIVFTFSEAVDPSSVTASSILVTDAAGRRVFGRFSQEGDGRVVTFTPLRRWKYATRYRYGVAQTVRALSGATLAQAFNGEFTTFAPRLLGNVALPDVRDVAVSGTLAAAATGEGLAVVDLRDPARPTVLARVPLGGGARSVALLAQTTIVGRDGQSRSGTFAVVATGGGTVAATLETYSLETPASPVLLGRTQLTVPPGSTPPTGVRNASGTPVRVVVDGSNRAFVAIRDVGIESVALGDAMPLDVSVPGRGLGPRYPAAGVADIADVALLGDQLVAVGAEGLIVLSPQTLTIDTALGLPDAPAELRAAARLPLGTNADGSLDLDAERGDVALAVTPSLQVLQAFALPFAQSPVLRAVVRLADGVTSLSVDEGERLAYVGLDARDAVLVDLAGPAGLQPIDLDRDGSEDAILGTLQTQGRAGRAVFETRRGLALVADGTLRLGVYQVRPPRVSFSAVRRDPARVAEGDERLIDETAPAFATDDGLLAEVAGLDVSLEPLVLVIEELPVSQGPRLASFPGGALARTLAVEQPVVPIDLLRGQPFAASQLVLSIRTLEGLTVTRRAFEVRPHELGDREIESLLLLPETSSIGEATTDLALTAVGTFRDGMVFNLTLGVTGSRYEVERQVVASVSGDGLVTALAGGTTQVAVEFQSARTTATVDVLLPARLVGLSSARPYATFRSLGEQRPVPALALFSDDSTVEVTRVAEVGFASSAPMVVDVDDSGTMTAVGAGQGVVTVSAGAALLEIEVVVEPRQPASVSGLTIEAPATALLDEGVTLTARAGGDGSLDGLPVTFALSGLLTVSRTATTDLSGAAVLTLNDLSSAGTLVVSATVVDPDSGQPRHASASVTMAAPPGDSEPNDVAGAPIALGTGRVLGGTLGPDDRIDAFAFESPTAGKAEVRLQIGGDAVPPGLTLVVRSLAGEELARVAVTSDEAVALADVPVGGWAVQLQADTPLTDVLEYQIEADVEQGPISLTAVSPSNGTTGTVVTLDGTGFGTSPAGVFVRFGNINGKILSVTPTRILAQVPAGAVNAPVTVVVGNRAVTGPVFGTGVPGPPSPGFFDRGAPVRLREDPSTGDLVNLGRVVVTFDPVMTRAHVDAVASSVSAVVAGWLPSDNSYVLDVPSVATLDALATLERQIRARPGIVAVRRDSVMPLDAGPVHPIDSTDNVGRWDNRKLERLAYDLIHLREAVEAVRTVPPFDQPNPGFRAVKVAVIDDGFNPKNGDLEVASNGRVSIRMLEVKSSRWEFADEFKRGRHGTPVAGIIGALNNGTSLSGILESLAAPEEAPPFVVHVYECEGPVGIDGACALSALEAIKADGAYDIVNMSFGSDYHGRPDADLREEQEKYRSRMLGERTLYLMSAGNDGIFADRRASAISLTERHVITVGATAVANTDRTGEEANRRAVYSPYTAANPKPRGAKACEAERSGSNCGKTLTIAAPGEDVLSLSRSNVYEGFTGTSAATPMTAGVAALLQAIGGATGGDRLAPDRLRKFLAGSARDISREWNPGSMRLLDAHAAVRTVLGLAESQRIYVSDAEAPGFVQQGAVIGFDVDPFTGQLTRTTTSDTIAFTVLAVGQETLQASRPSTLVSSPVGDRVYALVSSARSGGRDLGSGVLALSTLRPQFVAFIPLSGNRFPLGRNEVERAPVRFDAVQPPAAVTPDGRLLFVGIGPRLLVVNLVQGRVVESFAQLPAPHHTMAALAGPGTLRQRLDSLERIVRTGVGGRPGTRISAITLGPDGRTLYLAAQTGTGSGSQPGFVVQVDIDLTQDARSQSLSLEPDLTRFLTPRTPAVLVQRTAGVSLQGDEPSDLAVDAEGRALYLVNGGVDTYQHVPPPTITEEQFTTSIRSSIETSLFAAYYDGRIQVGLNLLDTYRQLDAIAVTAGLQQEARLLADEGWTNVVAPGATAVFDLSAPAPESIFAFPATVTFGWNPPPARPSLVNQKTFAAIFARRPHSIAMHPEGRRALVSFFQTGNFGVLDLEAQEAFRVAPQLPVKAFTGLVAVTPAIRFDPSLVPREPEDRRLLFPTTVTYAQNGRFAAGIHTGGMQAEGGALTVLDNEAITRGLRRRAESVPGPQDTERKYFSSRPLCAQADTTRPDRCETDVFVVKSSYDTPTGAEPLRRPRGVTVPPFVVVEQPRFGSHVTQSSRLAVRWRDARVTALTFDVLDLGPNDKPEEFAAFVNGRFARLTPTALQRRTHLADFAWLFGRRSPVAGHRYRVSVKVETSEGVLSETFVDLVYRGGRP